MLRTRNFNYYIQPFLKVIILIYNTEHYFWLVHCCIGSLNEWSVIHDNVINIFVYLSHLLLTTIYLIESQYYFCISNMSVYASLNPRPTKKGGGLPPQCGLRLLGINCSFIFCAHFEVKKLGGTTFPGGRVLRQSPRVRGVVATSIYFVQ